MKLTPKDKTMLHTHGYTEKDFPQIEEATGKTDYEYLGAKVTQRQAMRLLGRTIYLSGIARSAFHSSAVRYTPEGSPVYFRCRLF